MAKCSRCGAELKPNSKFCDSCGAPVEPVAAEGASQSSTDDRNTDQNQSTYQQPNQQNGYQQQNAYQQQNQQYQQNPYQQPNQQNPYQAGPQGNPVTEQAGTVGSWVLNLFLVGIPIVGLVMLFVWSFSGDTPLGKKNWAKAQLIWMLIGIAVSIITCIIIAAAGFSMVNMMGRYY